MSVFAFCRHAEPRFGATYRNPAARSEGARRVLKRSPAKRPDARQIVARPPVPKPSVVKVRSGSVD
jgi:hypothetical protein